MTTRGMNVLQTERRTGKRMGIGGDKRGVEGSQNMCSSKLKREWEYWYEEPFFVQCSDPGEVVLLLNIPNN